MNSMLDAMKPDKAFGEFVGNVRQLADGVNVHLALVPARTVQTLSPDLAT